MVTITYITESLPHLKGKNYPFNEKSYELAIKLEAIKKGKTLAEVAQEVGTTYNFLYNIMHGLRPGEEYVPRIAKLLDIRIEEYVA